LDVRVVSNRQIYGSHDQQPSFPGQLLDSSFRLLVDGVLQAPINDLDEVVASNSSQEGEVEFVVPSNVSTVRLQMGDVGEGKPALTLELQSPKQ